MNKAYRLIWNTRLNGWVVASELARACGKGSRAAVVLLALASAPLSAAELAAGALPGGVGLATNGNISGTPNEFGTFNFTIYPGYA